MTGGQTRLDLSAAESNQQQQQSDEPQKLERQGGALRVIMASEAELAAHEKRLDLVNKKVAVVCGGNERRPHGSQ